MHALTMWLVTDLGLRAGTFSHVQVSYLQELLQLKQQHGEAAAAAGGPGFGAGSGTFASAQVAPVAATQAASSTGAASIGALSAASTPGGSGFGFGSSTSASGEGGSSNGTGACSTCGRSDGAEPPQQQQQGPPQQQGRLGWPARVAELVRSVQCLEERLGQEQDRCEGLQRLVSALQEQLAAAHSGGGGSGPVCYSHGGGQCYSQDGQQHGGGARPREGNGVGGFARGAGRGLQVDVGGHCDGGGLEAGGGFGGCSAEPSQSAFSDFGAVATPSGAAPQGGASRRHTGESTGGDVGWSRGSDDEGTEGGDGDGGEEAEAGGTPLGPDAARSLAHALFSDDDDDQGGEGVIELRAQMVGRDDEHGATHERQQPGAAVAAAAAASGSRGPSGLGSPPGQAAGGFGRGNGGLEARRAATAESAAQTDEHMPGSATAATAAAAAATAAATGALLGAAREEIERLKELNAKLAAAKGARFLVTQLGCLPCLRGWLGCRVFAFQWLLLSGQSNERLSFAFALLPQTRGATLQWKTCGRRWRRCARRPGAR